MREFYYEDPTLYRNRDPIMTYTQSNHIIDASEDITNKIDPDELLLQYKEQSILSYTTYRQNNKLKKDYINSLSLNFKQFNTIIVLLVILVVLLIFLYSNIIVNKTLYIILLSIADIVFIIAITYFIIGLYKYFSHINDYYYYERALFTKLYFTNDQLIVCTIGHDNDNKPKKLSGRFIQSEYDFNYLIAVKNTNYSRIEEIDSINELHNTPEIEFPYNQLYVVNHISFMERHNSIVILDANCDIYTIIKPFYFNRNEIGTSAEYTYHLLTKQTNVKLYIPYTEEIFRYYDSSIIT